MTLSLLIFASSVPSFFSDFGVVMSNNFSSSILFFLSICSILSSNTLSRLDIVSELTSINLSANFIESFADKGVVVVMTAIMSSSKSSKNCLLESSSFLSFVFAFVAHFSKKKSMFIFNVFFPSKREILKNSPY